MIGLKKLKSEKKTSERRASRRPRNDNLKTALLLWCLPVGLTLMWRRGCTWPKPVKIALTALMAAVVVAVLVFPNPDASRTAGGVQLVSGNPDVEVYGPELPNFIVPGYTNDQLDSIIVGEETAQEDVHYVYAADGAECYHEYECKFAYASSQRLTVFEAYYLGFKPCGRCKPPVYTPGEELAKATENDT